MLAKCSGGGSGPSDNTKLMLQNEWSNDFCKIMSALLLPYLNLVSLDVFA